ncbi:MAG TPA: CDP-alcohol phosphatidyltransferase family protein [Spirochaetota bacterium]|nr:CDP-alcohol phosphatidyltransferase family protein [Spirochaetota bacterium]HOM38507.1 CDP-alcohol phosphatidyltransferase family protein [Spirochaetota bacterium]HPQ49047.1 CDP-alcohol phosphatidyltransferase family protein [Spirochaetota bacterium]
MIREYRQSLKRVEAEEVLDLLIFRPLGFLLAFLLKNTIISPNFITSLSMLLGLISGYFIYIRDYILGALFLFLANLLDCSDGQLARIKKQFSPIGRILDGFADYITYVSSYIGLGFGLMAYYNDITYVYVGLVAGASTIIQAAMFDDYRNIFIGGKNIDDLQKELIEVKSLKTATKNFIYKILYFFYIPYIKNQINIRKKSKIGYISPIFIRLFSFVGSTTHISLFIVLLLINKPEYYFYIISIVFNIYLFILLLFKNKLNKKQLGDKN